MHAPLSAAALFTPLPVSRTASPVPGPRRTPSKVEKRLRDTLRRDRAASSSRSRTATPVPYAAHDVFIAACCEHDADLDDDDDMLDYNLRRSSSHRATPAPPSPSSPSRQRPPRSPTSAHRPSLSLSSAPVLRHPTPLRPAGVPAPSRSDPSYGPASPPPPLMPHELALRSRLQGVLAAQPKPQHPSSAARALRAVSGPNYAPSARTSHSRSRSVSSRTDGDATWWAGPQPGFATQPTSPTTESSRSHSSPSLESLGFFPTPPSTPPSPSLALDQPASASGRPSFDVRTASQLCRNAPGLVSFKDVEGLGAPLDMDELDADETTDKGGHWWDLYAWSPFRRGSAGNAGGVSSSA